MPAPSHRCPRFWLLVLLCSCGMSMSRGHAHQPFESSTVARLGAGSLDLATTVSSEIAERLVGAGLQTPPDQEKQRAALQVAAKGLFEIQGDGLMLGDAQAFTSFHNGEWLFSVVYEMPKAPQMLRFKASYLKKLPPGYGGRLDVYGEDGGPLGQGLLLYRQPDKDVLLVKLGPILPLERALSVQEPTLGNGWGWWLCGLLAAIVAVWFFGKTEVYQPGIRTS